MDFILSDESVNSYNFKVITDGIDLERFKKNPVMLYFHNDWKTIGRWENIRKEDGKLLATAVFDENDAEALEIKRKVEEGFLKGVSIRFTMLEAYDNIVTSCELTEASITPIPSNQNAIKLSFGAKNVTLSNKNTMNAKLRKKFKLSESASEADVEKAIDELVQENEDLADSIATLEAQNKAIKEKLDELEEQVLEEELSLAISSGKITADKKKELKALGKSNPENLRLFLSAIPEKKVVKLSEQIKQGNTATSGTTQKLSWYLKNDPQGLAEIKENDPAMYEKIVKNR
jgi:HK97 family phage prohead protease